MIQSNILLITTDEQRFDTISALGNPNIYTPHLNWLVDRGIAFTNAYADCPICMPSRATIMTGLSGSSLGLIRNNTSIVPLQNRPTLPGILTAGGYQTHAQGKMHFHPIRAHYGFEEMELPLDYFREKQKYGRTASKQSGVGENEIEPVLTTAKEEDTMTWWTVDRSIDFLETRDETRPFFLWTSFAKPHPPFECCPNYWSLYQNLEMTEPARGDWEAPGNMMAATWQLDNAWRLSPQQMRESKKAYYACITQIDYNLGRLFDRMREMGLLKNTWIIFTSDHGDMLGDHGMGAKTVFLEGSAHIPLLVVPPEGYFNKHPAPSIKCRQLVTLADIMPTILSICGLSCPACDGTDLIQVYKDNLERPYFGISSAPCGYLSAVRWQNYKLLRDHVSGKELLFDIEHDPRELHNLFGLPEYTEVGTRYHALLEEYLRNHAPETLKKPASQSDDVLTDQDIPRWPGFHSNFCPTDVLH